MQFSTGVYGNDEFWREHKLLIRNLKILNKNRYRKMAYDLLLEKTIEFIWENNVIEVSLEQNNFIHQSLWVKKNGRAIGGGSRFFYQSISKRLWISNFFAKLEAGLEETFVDIPQRELIKEEIAAEDEYLEKIVTLEEVNIEYFQTLAKRLIRRFRLLVEYEDAVIEYKLGLVGCSYSIIYREEIGESASGYSRFGWRRRDKLSGMPFIFARHEVEYGKRA